MIRHSVSVTNIIITPLYEQPGSSFTGVKISFQAGGLNLLGATRIIIGWYAVRTCKQHSKWYTLPPKLFCTLHTKGKGKVFPPQAEAGPWKSGRLRLWIFSTFDTMKVVRSSPLRTGRLYPQDFSWYSFLEAESTPGHMVPSLASEKIPSDTTGDRSRDPPTSSAVP